MSFLEKLDQKNQQNVNDCASRILIGSQVRVKDDDKIYEVIGLSCEKEFDLEVVLVQIDDLYHVGVDEIVELNGEPFHYEQPSPGPDAEDWKGFVPKRHEYDEKHDVHYTTYTNYFREVCTSCYQVPIHVKVGQNQCDGDICCRCMCNLN